MPNDSDRYHFIPLVIIGVVLALSVSLAIGLGSQKAAAIRSELSERSQTIAASLGPDGVSQLKGETSDENRQAYERLKEQLADIKQANHGVRSIYLAGMRNDQVFFYVDSEKPDSRDYSPAGEAYDDATPEFKAMFTAGKPVVEGPVTDDFGTFISGLAPIFKASSNQVAAVIGMDIDATAYWRDISLAALVPLSTGLCVMLVVAIFEWIRRKNMQMLALRSELVSVASHELSTPIIGIRWGAESLERLVTDERAKPMINAIRGSAESLRASAEDILQLTHTINHTKVHLKPVDMTKLIQEVFEAQALTAEQKGVELHFGDSWPKEGLTIECDAEKMKRVMHNMVSNAVKYTRDNTQVTVGYQQDDKMHRLLVSDQGIGIPPAEQTNVLKGGYRASNAIASKVQGTGLGLYLVRTVLEQHRGKVNFISEENKGTTFILYLPKRR